MSDTLKHSMSGRRMALAMAVICVVGVACGGGPAGPVQGSPEWYLQAAKENFANSDFTKTSEQLGEAMKGDGDIATEAAVWRLVLHAGLALGYDDLNDAFVEGMEATPAMRDQFQPSVNEYRRRIRVSAIEFAEGVGPLKSLIDAGDTVMLNVPLPSGNGSVSPLLASVQGGNPVGTQAGGMENQTLNRGIFTALSTLAGGMSFTDLADKAAAGPIEVPSDEVAFGVAELLLEISVMFDRAGLNDPKIREHVFNMAQQWSEPHLETEKLAERVEDFEFDMENERRDMDGKRRIKKDD